MPVAPKGALGGARLRRRVCVSRSAAPSTSHFGLFSAPKGRRVCVSRSAHAERPLSRKSSPGLPCCAAPSTRHPRQLRRAEPESPRAQARLPAGAWRCSQRRWAGTLRCRCSARCRYPRVWEARESAGAAAGLVPPRARTHPRLITAFFIRLDPAVAAAARGGFGGRRQRWQEPDQHGARVCQRPHPASASLRRTCRAGPSPTRDRGAEPVKALRRRRRRRAGKAQHADYSRHQRALVGAASWPPISCRAGRESAGRRRRGGELGRLRRRLRRLLLLRGGPGPWSGKGGRLGGRRAHPRAGEPLRRNQEREHEGGRERIIRMGQERSREKKR